MVEIIKNKYKELFGNLDNTRLFFSPGRVNIIGEHIDYNGGYVMPCAIDRGTYFIIAKNNSNVVNAYSMQFEDLGVVSFNINDESKDHSFVDYVKGVIKFFNIDFGFNFVCNGTIPHSSGLSSSASFTTGLGYGLSTLKGKTITGTENALLCKDIENKFMGVNCGIMDQFIVCNGKKDMALLLDCATLEYKEIPLVLKDSTLIIANTNKKRRLSDSKYNERKAECEKSLEIINNKLNTNYKDLCSITDLNKALEVLDDDNLKHRVKHVVTENNRTKEACDALVNNDIERLGKLLTASHMSLKDDYEVTGIELDTLVLNFLKQDGCIGARMTGAGFGGCSIALVKKGKEEKAIENVRKVYLDTIGYEPSFYLVNVEGGVKEII